MQRSCEFTSYLKF